MVYQCVFVHGVLHGVSHGVSMCLCTWCISSRIATVFVHGV